MSVESTRVDARVTEADGSEPVEKTAASAGTSRRAFLGGAGTAVAVGGLLAVVPKVANGGGLTNDVSNPDAQRAVEEAAERIHVSTDEPLVVHVSDLASGEINLYAGESHVVLHDPELARRLAAAVAS